jgi:hypothetical protein
LKNPTPHIVNRTPVKRARAASNIVQPTVQTYYRAIMATRRQITALALREPFELTRGDLHACLHPTVELTGRPSI